MAILRFLELLGSMVLARNGGKENDVTKLITYGRLAVRAGNTGKRHLEHAVATMETLVREDRQLNAQELADLDASIEGKLARAAGVQIPAKTPTPPAGPNPETTELGAAETIGKRGDEDEVDFTKL